jgi:hypothetical protein
VDSGAFLSIFTATEAERLCLKLSCGQPRSVVVGDGSRITVYTHRLSVQLGAYRREAVIGFSPQLRVGFNLLGRQGFFTHFDVTFSDTKGRITFRPIPSKDRPLAMQEIVREVHAYRRAKKRALHHHAPD